MLSSVMNKTIRDTLIAAVLLIAGVYIAWKLIKAVGYVIIAVAVILLLWRVFRRG
jgi:hypothetical protein